MKSEGQFFILFIMMEVTGKGRACMPEGLKKT